VELTFYGTRGSCPCAGGQYAAYGGNTACVALRADDGELFILDLGTGLRSFGFALDAEAPRALMATVLLTHLHLDHVVGLPYFSPLRHSDTVLDLYGPKQASGDLRESLAAMVHPPFFPVPIDMLPGLVRCHDTGDEDFAVGTAKVRARSVSHRGPTLGYRVEVDGVSVAYVPDHQQPIGPGDLDAGILELCSGVDVLVHDGQYTEAEFAEKQHWGHSTVEFAVRVAQEAGARHLVLFHHDPAHDVDRLLEQAAELAAGRFTVSAAREGERLSPGRD
jgi:phosphoribosyl 1,2-cyclic phosphodiesterase